MKRKTKRYDWIAWMINEYQFSIGVEVGAATGVTTEFILKNCPSLTSLYIVDLWEPIESSKQWNRSDMESIFRSKFEGEKKLTILKGMSWEMAIQIEDKSLDFAFIDASHDYDSVVKDISAWYPKVKRGGVFCGHDLHFEGVNLATEQIFGGRRKEAGIDNMWFVMV